MDDLCVFAFTVLDRGAISRLTVDAKSLWGYRASWRRSFWCFSYGHGDRIRQSAEWYAQKFPTSGTPPPPVIGKVYVFDVETSGAPGANGFFLCRPERTHPDQCARPLWQRLCGGCEALSSAEPVSLTSNRRTWKNSSKKTEFKINDWPHSGRMAQPLNSLTPPTRWVPHPFALFAKGWERMKPAPREFHATRGTNESSPVHRAVAFLLLRPANDTNLKSLS